MTSKSKEALEQLNIFISREKHINSEKNKIVNDCVDIIKQDLERLERLESEAAVHNYAIRELKQENEKLKKYKAFYEFIRNRFFIDLIEREDGSFKIGFEPKEPIQDQPRFTEVDYLLDNLLKEVLGDD